ncbi:MAG: hypothetical protein GY943_08735, partial [Chloroflexi bacterium]|nr:hypothetical protein [Chloroflexota bacterium]
MVQVRNFLRRIDTGFLIAIAICLLAIWPFLSIPSLPQETDAELHIFRLAELSFLVRGGEFYPRWAPNFFHGYGYPIFNYYAPLSYYVGLIFELLPQIDPVGAVKIVFVMGILMGGIGVYGLVRDYWGRLAGYVAVALFVYAPYIQYIDPHARGVLAESFSFGVFPIALWTLDRLRRQQTAVRWITAVISVAAVILSHNLMALLFFGILCTWVVWQFIWTSNKEEMQSRKQLLLPGFSLICGLAVAAIFWLPVLLEQDAVNLNTLIGVGDNYDFHTHFLSLREMLSFSLRLDWGATEPLFRFNLGVGQWITALIAVVILILGKPTQQRQLWFFLISALFLIFLMLPQSAWIWENVPYLPFFQFPWRLLGATAVFLAILGGAGIAEIAKLVEQSKFKQIAPAIPAVVVVLVLLLALPLSQPMPWPDFGEVNVLRMSLIEHSGRWLGTTSTVDYVPITVDTLPKRVSGINKLYEGLPIDRVNWATTPEAASVEVEHITPLHFRYTISTPKDFTFRLFLFDFPGWEATLDGDPV